MSRTLPKPGPGQVLAKVTHEYYVVVDVSSEIRNLPPQHSGRRDELLEELAKERITELMQDGTSPDEEEAEILDDPDMEDDGDEDDPDYNEDVYEKEIETP
jgi:hypothetical protein